MKLITIGREFGSGGRELGQRLAETLGFAYYDSEIIREVAEKTNLSEAYVERMVEKRPFPFFSITHGGTFSSAYDPHFALNNTIYNQQSAILKDMANRSDCVIVGRCADYILRELHPLRVFVYADMPHKMARCRERAPEGEHLSDRKLAAKIRAVDKDRRHYYEFFTSQKWGSRECYDLMLNTAMGIDACLAAVTALVK